MSLFYRLIVIMLLVGSSTSWAFFENGENISPGETQATSKKMLACTLVKASFKGTNKKRFEDGTNKSVEGYCHSNIGEPMYFSASTDKIETIKQHAGRQVLIYLSSMEEVKNAKTDHILFDVQPTDNRVYSTQKICGPETGKYLFQGEKVWSRGFRLAHAHAAQQEKKGWLLKLQEGHAGKTLWGEASKVRLGRYCNAHAHEIMQHNTALLYFYVQEKQKGTYTIESVSRIVLTPPKEKTTR